MKKKAVTDFLLNHNNGRNVSFHMPGHKGSAIYRENGYGEFLDNIMECDITEIAGADNLFQPEDIIMETMNRYKAIYGAKASYLLINGSSAGLIAAIMTVAHEGGKIIMARNCHKSIFNALTLGKITPIYVYPEIIEDYGISGEITTEDIKGCMEENPDAAGVILPSPNYYGVCSDIKSIAEMVHKKGKVLIVDQAHGAHLALFDKYGDGNRSMSAEKQGADIVINSTHKTLASFTQSAVVNIMSDFVDRGIFEDKLQAIESTSPSYILLASLDINADIVEKNGERLIGEWEKNLKYFYTQAPEIQGLRVMEHPMLDRTKINLDMSLLGIDGLELEKLLIKKGIFVELVTGSIVMCMSGIGNKREDYERLIDALNEIASSRKMVENPPSPVQELAQRINLSREIPAKKEYVKLEDAVGQVCAVPIIPYPPGIPIVCPGEVIDGEIIAYVKGLRERGEKVMGIDEKGRVSIGKPASIKKDI